MSRSRCKDQNSVSSFDGCTSGQLLSYVQDMIQGIMSNLCTGWPALSRGDRQGHDINLWQVSGAFSPQKRKACAIGAGLLILVEDAATIVFCAQPVSRI